MKRPANVADLTASLTAAAAAPLVRSAPEPSNEPQPKRAGSKAVFLRIPDTLHARYEAEAMARTKATGKGVTIQQVMLEKLEGAL